MIFWRFRITMRYCHVQRNINKAKSSNASSLIAKYAHSTMPKSTCDFWLCPPDQQRMIKVHIFFSKMTQTMRSIHRETNSCVWNKYYFSRIKTRIDKRQRPRVEAKVASSENTAWQQHTNLAPKMQLLVCMHSFGHKPHTSTLFILLTSFTYFFFFFLLFWSILLARACVYLPIFIKSFFLWRFIVQYASSC